MPIFSLLESERGDFPPCRLVYREVAAARISRGFAAYYDGSWFRLSDRLRSWAFKGRCSAASAFHFLTVAYFPRESAALARC